MFNLEHNFSLSPFADDTLPPVTKKLNLNKIGIEETDVTFNATNTVAGRVIDMGGMAIENPVLMDKTVLKFYKKIVNRNTEKEQKEVITNLKKLIENPKTPNRSKIEEAIEEAERSLGFDLARFNSTNFLNFKTNSAPLFEFK